MTTLDISFIYSLDGIYQEGFVKMELNASFTDLFSHFDQKLQGLTICLAIKQNSGQEWQEALLHNVVSQLSSLRISLSLIKSRLREQKEILDKANILKNKLQSALEVANYAKENIPGHLSKNIPAQVNVSETESSVSVKSSANSDNVPLTEIQLTTLEKKYPVSPVSHHDESSKNYINYLKVAEYDAVPKYMKGRLTYNKINSVIDEINKTFEIKYKLMHQKKSTLPEKKKQIYKAYKEQENAQAQGFSFIIDADLKEHTNIRIDATLRSIIVILRHCGRIKEIRGGGLTRYAITFY